MQKDFDIDSLEVRNYSSLKWKTLIALFLCVTTVTSIMIKIFSKNFWLNFKPSFIFYFVALAITVLGIIYYSKSLYYNKWIQLKIDKVGIWTPKYKTWHWKDIWYFNTSSEMIGNGRVNFLYIKLKDGVDDQNNSLTIPLDNYDKSKEDIRSFIEKFATIHGVQDLGDEVIN